MKRKWKHGNSFQMHTGRGALILDGITVRKGDWTIFATIPSHEGQWMVLLLGTPPAGVF